ncbi:MAG: hypothetical protein ACTSQ8_22785 [Candidatus Helarchaeota archaeon]
MNAIKVAFTAREKELIIEHTFYDPDFGGCLKEDSGNQLFIVELTIVELTFDELEDMIGYIAASANHTDNKELEFELDALYDRFYNLVESIGPGRL